MHYSHVKTNSCGFLIALFGSTTYTVRKKASDKPGQILIIEALIDDIEFILICITLMSRMVNYLFRTDKPVRKFRSYFKINQ